VSRAYQFDIKHRWQLEAAPQELTAIVLDTTNYSKWCARILMNFEVIEPGEADGRGLSLRFHTKGWLPYSFLFTATVVDLVAHEYMKIKVSGDFEGFGITQISGHDDTYCYMDLRWMADVKHPVLRPLVWLLHAIMERNHKWAVGWVRKMFQAEVFRRRQGDAEFAAPPPTFDGFLAFARGWHSRRARRMGWQQALMSRDGQRPGD